MGQEGHVLGTLPREFAAENGNTYNLCMWIYAFLVAFLLFGYVWLKEIVLRQEKARFTRRRRWRMWLFSELTKERPDDDDSAA